jgi:hypothetical protein
MSGYMYSYMCYMSSKAHMLCDSVHRLLTEVKFTFYFSLSFRYFNYLAFIIGFTSYPGQTDLLVLLHSWITVLVIIKLPTLREPSWG